MNINCINLHIIEGPKTGTVVRRANEVRMGIVPGLCLVPDGNLSWENVVGYLILLLGIGCRRCTFVHKIYMTSPRRGTPLAHSHPAVPYNMWNSYGSQFDRRGRVRGVVVM